MMAALRNLARARIATHPEPIIFVHGITASRMKREGVIDYLHNTARWFDKCHFLSNNVPEFGVNSVEAVQRLILAIFAH